MVEIRIDYEGQLRCGAKHMPSQRKMETDAPTDNHGRGESFSPTDLLATGLGTCMATVMGIAGKNKDVELRGMRVVIGKEMSDDLPRRIAKLNVEVFMPIPEDHPERRVLQSAALSCPVQHSIHPDIEVPIQWHWQEIGSALASPPPLQASSTVMNPSRISRTSGNCVS
ncbi:OsmC family protein [Akkermansiaceae bacterium]|nr:OsmC family protein [Akkermansiaceae bacterium]